MWIPLKTEVLERFAAAESFFKATRSLGGTTEQTAKGLMFVQIYAVYEYTARAVVRSAIVAIAAHRHKPQDLLPSLMALFLDSGLSGLRDCPKRDVWERRIALFESLFSDSPVELSNTVFPSDGTHFRHKQLQTIFKVLGIQRTPAQRKRHLYRVDEVVNQRNAIAHGDESPANVGRTYTRAEISNITRQIKSVCLLLISAVEKQCTDTKRHLKRS